MLFTKRRKLVFASILLSIGLLVTQFVGQDWRYGVIAGISVLSGVLTYWALYEDLKGSGWFLAPVLPILYPTAVALFYFLLPEKIVTRAAILTLFGIGMYAIFLTENIYVVATLRTIQLARAAQAVGFLFTLLIAFFLFDTIFSFKLAGWWNAGLVALTSLPLVLHGVWSVDLSERLPQRLLLYAIGLAVSMGELALMISFWPVSIVVASLFLVTALYIGLGLIQHHVGERLFGQTIREYVQVGVIVLIVTFIAARWGG